MSEMRIAGAVAMAGAVLWASAAAADADSLKVSVGGFANGQPIPPQFAFCVPAAQGHVTNGPNRNPKLSWSKGPAKTKSYAIIVTDPDVPGDATDLNAEGKTLPAKMPRVDFYHWVLVDIPASAASIPEAADSDVAVPHGKPPGPTKIGVRGVNSYTGFFAKDEAMKGDYGGYDGPCPPWNDERLHHYRFAVYALDLPSLQLIGPFEAPLALDAMKGHILAKGEVVGTYTLNAAMLAKKRK